MKTVLRSLSLGLALFYTSCETLPTASDSNQYVVTAKRSPFYRYGPAQAMGADFTLIQGQVVTMLKPGSGFSQIQTSSGDAGYVANEEIAPAPVEDIVAQQQSLPESPQLPVMDRSDSREPLPEPAIQEAPLFRY